MYEKLSQLYFTSLTVKQIWCKKKKIKKILQQTRHGTQILMTSLPAPATFLPSVGLNATSSSFSCSEKDNNNSKHWLKKMKADS